MGQGVWECTQAHHGIPQIPIIRARHYRARREELISYMGPLLGVTHGPCLPAAGRTPEAKRKEGNISIHYESAPCIERTLIWHTQRSTRLKLQYRPVHSSCTHLLSLSHLFPYRGRCKEGRSRCLLVVHLHICPPRTSEGGREGDWMESRSIGGLFASASCSCKRPLRFWTDGRTEETEG